MSGDDNFRSIILMLKLFEVSTKDSLAKHERELAGTQKEPYLHQKRGLFHPHKRTYDYLCETSKRKTTDLGGRIDFWAATQLKLDSIHAGRTQPKPTLCPTPCTLHPGPWTLNA